MAGGSCEAPPPKAYSIAISGTVASCTNQASMPPGVVSRWIDGRERMQLDKLRMLGDDFFAELLVALAQTCDGVEVRTQVTLIARTA